MNIKIKEIELDYEDSIRLTIPNHPEKFIIINRIGGELNIQDSSYD